MKNKKTRKLIILAIALVAIVATSAATFAYWDSLQDEDTVVLAAGEGVTLTANANEFATGNLVPNNDAIIMKDGDVKEIVVSYDVELDKEFESGVTLTVAVSNILIDGSAANSALINVDYEATYTMISGAATTVTVTVTMTEPASKEIYDAVANKDITFDITFTAAVA